MVIAAAAPAIAVPVLLPPPSGAPLSIDFAEDPLLRFGRTAMAAQAFLESLGAAVEKHPAVAAAIAEQQATQAVRTQVRAELFPQIDAQLLGQRAFARNFGDRTAIVESLQPRSRSDAIVSGEQLLYDFGATGNRIAAANDRIKAAEAEVARVADETALRAATASYDVMGAQSLVTLSAAMVARQRDILADVHLRQQQGVGTAGDVARAEAMLAETEAEMGRFERQLGQSRARYREAFGSEPPAELARTAPPASAANSLDTAQALARLAPAVQNALKRAAAARRDYRAARADGLPRLSAGVNGSRYDVFTGSDYEVRGTVVLRQSLFAGGRQRGVVAEAAAKSRGAAFLADETAAESERDAGSAFSDLAATEKLVVSLEAGYTANRRARDGYVEQFRVSRGTLLELLRAEHDYFAAAANYLQGVIDLDVARYTLLARTGELLPLIGVKLTAEPL